MEANGEDSDFAVFFNNRNINPVPLPSPQAFANQPIQPFMMPENQPNGGLSLRENHIRQEHNLSLSALLEREFGRLSLSTPSHHSRFLAPYAHALNGGGGGRPTDPMFDVGAFPRQMTNLDFERLKFQSPLGGYNGLYRDALNGFANLNSTSITGFDELDYLYNNGRNLANTSHGGRNIVNSPAMIRSRNGTQYQSPYQSLNSISDNNELENLGRSTRNACTNSLVSSLYLDVDDYGNSNGGVYNSNGSVYRSRLRSASLEEMKGNVLSWATDQNGCRLLKKKIEERKPEDIDLIFLELKDHIRPLMVHQFGNYLIQIFFDVCDQAKISQILASVISHHQTFLNICLDIHGTRAMQKLLQNLTTLEQRASVAYVLGIVDVTVPLMTSIHGHHVMQHCINVFPYEEIATILRVAADCCVPIATNKSGCCVLQLCLTRAREDHKEERLVAEITANALFLSNDPYGNYVVQAVVDLGVPHYSQNLLAVLKGNFVPLSLDKHGSNVVEKCIKDCSADQAAEIIKEIIYNQNILMVIQDAFGNYVVQCAIHSSKGELHDEVTGLIQKYYPFLHSHPYGKRALAAARGSRPLARSSRRV